MIVPEADPARLRALARSLIGEEIVYFPVRHHSPACAWHLRELMRVRSPRAVLVEGPSAFTPLIPLIVHEDARAPFAVYTYCVEKPMPQARQGDDAGKAGQVARRHAAFYPFCDYSPELVALREGVRCGADLRFIDLDYPAQCLVERDKEVDARQSLLDERHMRRSRFLKVLAERNGCRDHDELWDHLFEATCRSLDTAEFVARIAVYCRLAREETPAAELERDGTAAREREMAWHIRTALDTDTGRNGPVLVVTGGFHTVALPSLVAQGTQRPEIDSALIKDQHASLIRYSFDRLDRLNGYAAGMPAPAWYQKGWEEACTGNATHAEKDGETLRNTALHMLLDVAAGLRETDTTDHVPTANVVAAYEHALRLAVLRGRPGPTREDVLDAIRSCLVKGAADGEGALVLGIARRVFAGQTMGRVPPGAGVPPLVSDFERRARLQRLKIDESLPRRLSLDLYRRPEHRAVSRLLHGLEQLGVPFALRTAGPDFVSGIGLERLHEHWEYQYSPATQAGLIEAAVYGTTVPEAVAAGFVETLQRLEQKGGARSAAVTVSYLAKACVLGLHDQVALLRGRLETHVAEDSEFPSLCAATTQLLLLWESREPLEARGLDDLPVLLATVYRRACFLIQDLAASPETTQGEVISALMSLRELLHGVRAEGFDAALFWEALRLLLQREPVPPLLAGAAHGLLFGAGLLDAPLIVIRARGELQGREEPHRAIAYLRGLLQTAREVCWQMPELLDLLDEQLTDWSDDEFLRVLPELRLAFAEMTPRETDRIAAAVAEKHGGTGQGPLVNYDLTLEEIAANLVLNKAVRDALEADGLGWWVGA